MADGPRLDVPSGGARRFGSFLRLNPLIAIVTNIDADHLENYGGDFARVQAAFHEFLHRLPFYVLAVLCIDDPEVRALAEEMPRHLVTYGFAEDADVRASAVHQDGVLGDVGEPREAFARRE